MASVQEIKNRINGIAKTKQITRSMRMVSSSKVHKSRRIFENSIPYANQTEAMMDVLAAAELAKKNRFFLPAETVERVLILAISTDRGLCGAYNINIARRITTLVKEYPNAQVITVGTKVNSSLKREGIAVETSYVGMSESPFYEEADMLVADVMKQYQSGAVQKVFLVYTEFTNMLEQHTVAKELLPYISQNTEPMAGTWEFEPEGMGIVEAIAPIYLNAVIYRALCEAALCEQSARVSSMDAAARNSDELVQKLTLQYNQIRQAVITNSMIEISGGVAAQEEK